MPTKADGGQAFPVPLAQHAPGVLAHGEPGMSLRQWYAGQTLNSAIAMVQSIGPDVAMAFAKGKGVDIAQPDWSERLVAKLALEFADALIVEGSDG